MGAIEELEAVTAEVAAGVGPKVVSIGSGSGMVVADGVVATCAHNVRGLDDVAVHLADGRRVEAEVAGVDADGDLAALRVDLDLDPVERADAVPGAGAVVFGLANPGGRGLRTSWGQVTATDRSFRGPRGRRNDGAIEHATPLPRGSSGGPLVDPAGRLVGINTHRLRHGFYLAVPTDERWQERLDGLLAGTHAARPRIGISVVGPAAARQLREAVGLPAVDGVLVRDVAKDGPAASAGLQRGDLIVAAAGTAVASVDDLHGALDAASGAIELGVVRGAEELTVTVELS